jgi:hypothetical protein
LALTRAQLLMGTASQGTVLTGQVQAVKQGTGILIAGDGTISVDWTGATGLVKLNNVAGYNAYVWPSADGAANTFLKTDGGGNLSWAKAGVTVSSTAPSSPTIGDLWFDCATGQLKVWESCTTGVAQWSSANIGLPVLPINTSALPVFTGGAGTVASPYLCTVTTTPSGSTTLIVNTVTITGLAPFQSVPIQDLNAVTNGGRFSFTNSFADATGTLVFNTVFRDLPASVAGTSFTASIRVGIASVYISSVVTITAVLALVSPGSLSGTPAVGATVTYTQGSYSGGTAPVTEAWVWKDGSGSVLQTGGLTYLILPADVGTIIFVDYTATDSIGSSVSGSTSDFPSSGSITSISLLSPGTISGTPTVGQTLTYSPGSATDGVPSYTYTWVWKKASDNSVLQTGGSTYVIPGTVAGDRVYITLTATDSVSSTVSGDTTNFPASPTVIAKTPFTISINYPSATAPTTASTSWTIAGTTLSSNGCVEISTDAGGTWGTGPAVIATGGTLLTRWLSSPACGGAPDGTTITGMVFDSGYESTGSLLLDSNPNPFSFTPDNNIVPGQAGESNDVLLSGFNTALAITYDVSSTGTSIQGSTDSGATWTTIPTSGSAFILYPGQTLRVRATTGALQATTYSAVINAGAQTATFLATTASGSIFPLTPIAFPTTTVGVGGPVTWADGATTLTSTGCIQFSVNGGAYGQGPTAITNGDTVSTKWDQTLACGGAPHGTTITGALTDGALYTNSASLTIDRVPNAFTFTDLTSVTPSTQQTSNAITISGTNATSYLTYTAGATTLTSVQASVNGGAYAIVPTSGTTFPVNPGDVITVRATPGAFALAYTAVISVGDSAGTPDITSDEWSVTPSGVAPSIATPSILTPADKTKSTGANVTVTSSAYAPQNGAGSQKCTDWEVYKGGYPATSSAITAINQGPAWVQMTYINSNDILDVETTAAGVTYAGGRNSSIGITRSSAPTTWTSVSSGLTGTVVIYDLANLNTLPTPTGTVAVATGTSGTTATHSSSATATSTFTTTFFNQAAGAYNGMGNVAGVTEWIAVGVTGKISTYGTFGWTTRASGTTQNLNSISNSFVTASCVIVGNGGVVLTSTNGTTFTSRVGGFGTTNINKVVRDDDFGLFIAAGDAGKIATSPDGITWTQKTVPFSSNITALATADGKVWAGSSAGDLAYSSDLGTTWTSTSIGWGTIAIRGITENPFTAKIYVVGDTGKSAYSNFPALDTLTVSNLSAAGFSVGSQVVGNTSGATGTISTLTTTTATITNRSGNFVVGETISVQPATYAVWSSATCDTVNLTSYPLTGLTPGAPYYVRCRYNSVDTTPVVSSWSAWSSFSTEAAPVGQTTQIGSTTSSNTSSLSWPSGTTVGDFAIWVDSPTISGAVAPVIPTPTGFTSTQINSVSSGGGSTGMRLSHGFITAAMLSAGVVTGYTSGSAKRKVLLVYRPPTGSTGVVVSTPLGATGTSVATIPAAQTQSITGSASGVFTFGALRLGSTGGGSSNPPLLLTSTSGLLDNSIRGTSFLMAYGSNSANSGSLTNTFTAVSPNLPSNPRIILQSATYRFT